MAVGTAATYLCIMRSSKTRPNIMEVAMPQACTARIVQLLLGSALVVGAVLVLRRAHAKSAPFASAAVARSLTPKLDSALDIATGRRYN